MHCHQDASRTHKLQQKLRRFRYATVKHVIAIVLWSVQERMTAKEAMSHPYFNPVRQQEGL